MTGLDKTSADKPNEAQHSGSASRTIALIGAMLVAVLACMVYVAWQQSQLSQIREDARETRRVRQALMATDRTVLTGLAKASDSPIALSYAGASSALDALGTDHLPTTMMRDNQPTPTKAALATLRTAWDDIVANVEEGQIEVAHEIYRARQVDRSMQAMLAAISAQLDGLEARYAATESRIATATFLAFLSQIVTGVLSIAAFFYAARRGARASKARNEAISTANATRERVTRLFQMTDMLQSAADHSDANAVLRSTATELLPNFGGALYVFNNSGDRLTLSTQWALADDIKLTDSFAPQNCWALKRGKQHINLPGSNKLRCEHHGLDISVLELPMIARGEILGLLHIYCDRDDAERELNEVASIATALADAMSLALSNLALRDKLRSQALRDPLTGLYNRRYMEDTLERMVRLAEREKGEVSVMMIDLDHFKRLNDQHGHAKGDSVLRDVAAIITNQMRDSDVACRYGGEELMVILPHCSLEQAAKKAEKLRAAIAGLSDPKGAQVTASFGVASIPTTSVSTRDLMAAADAALYEAKQQGRNRVNCAAPAASRAAAQLEDEFRMEMAAAE